MPKRKWTLGELLRVSSEYLKAKSIESPRLTAEILLAQQLSTDRISLYLNFEGGISEADLDGYRGLIARRAAGEPLHYITGRREFWSLDFKVDPRVLIPRPETEVLVEQALSEARVMRSAGPIRVLEIGTGSGAVAVALAKELPASMVTATDISGEALELAGENMLFHNVPVRFLKGDLFAALPEEETVFDIIVSNPPYVAREEWDSLPVEVRCHEPRTALDGGRGGTEVIERILGEAGSFLAPGGVLLIEMAPNQTGKMAEMALGLYDDTAIIRDYSGRQRVLRARRALEA
jgi:release factor glutamine methyltransferase